MQFSCLQGSFACQFLILWLAASAIAQTDKVVAPIPPADNPRQAAINLVDVRWEKNRSNREYSELEVQKFPDSEKVLLAYTLNRMQHRRNKDALESARKLHQIAPENLNGGVFRIWLETLNNNIEEALLAIQDFGPQLAKAQDLDPRSRIRILKRLGRVVGYIQGPAAAKAEPDMLADAILAITQGLPPDQLNVFNRYRDEVLAKYENLTRTHAQFINFEKQKKAFDHANQTQAIVDQNQQIDNQARQLVPKINELRDEGNQKLNKVRSQALPLQSELASLRSRIDSIRYELDCLYFDLAVFRKPYPGHHHNQVVLVGPHWGGPSLLWADIRNREYELSRLQERFRVVAGQLGAIDVQGTQILDEYGFQINDINSQLTDMDRAKRRNAKELGKLAKGPRVAPGKISSRKKRANALKTYDPISLELYRLIVLQQLN